MTIATWQLDQRAAELAGYYGSNPQAVGADRAADAWGDLVHDAAVALELDPETLCDDCWQHFQDVAANCESTTMTDWLAHLNAIPQGHDCE